MTLPARPALCIAIAFVPHPLFHFHTWSKYRYFYWPVSITYLIFGTVKEVSAIFVDKINLRQFFGCSWNIKLCYSGGSEEYKCKILYDVMWGWKLPLLFLRTGYSIYSPSALISSSFSSYSIPSFYSTYILHNPISNFKLISFISSLPVRNTSTSPGGSCLCIFKHFLTAH